MSYGCAVTQNTLPLLVVHETSDISHDSLAQAFRSDRRSTRRSRGLQDHAIGSLSILTAGFVRLFRCAFACVIPRDRHSAEGGRVSSAEATGGGGGRGQWVMLPLSRQRFPQLPRHHPIGAQEHVRCCKKMHVACTFPDSSRHLDVSLTFRETAFPPSRQLPPGFVVLAVSQPTLCNHRHGSVLHCSSIFSFWPNARVSQ